MANSEIQDLEQQIYELNVKLVELRKANRFNEEVPNYKFQTSNGEPSLLELFGERDKLLVIHNMGQGCRYCTLWADGFNGFVPHLESVMSVVLVSKDEPAVQRRFANSRGWQFLLASHAGGRYIQEQSVMKGESNMPGAVVYERKGDQIYRQSSCVFGPGDLYCSMWSLLGLAGLSASDWTPQYSYWKRPQKLDDGGENLCE
ncbi:DUF899 domain-containing protein [Vibrio sp. T187]|uniref:DUF899 family protein n=1 Tax=Vibrio TaxID=662 RepID=UPI0010C939E8|nr:MULTISPECIES: DUF899 family protein [Vibrio]MBW3698339.1 DUF899 domain-containing protein [Vibrio sp. T187]